MNTMELHVINLDSQPDRWRESKQRLESLGYAPKRFPGVVPTCENTQGWAIDYGLPKGLIGCFMSHFLLIERFFRSSPGDLLIVAEDDLIPLKGSVELQKILSEMPEDTDLLDLGCRSGCTDTPDLDSLDGIVGFLRRLTKDPPKPVGLFFRSNHFIGAHFYAITRRGAEKLLQAGRVITEHYDIYLGDLSNFVMYNTREPFAITNLMGACTDSNNVKNPVGFCWMDRFNINQNMTAGYFTFSESSVSLRHMDFFAGAVIGYLIAWIFGWSWAYFMANTVVIVLLIQQMRRHRNAKSFF